MLVLTEIQLNTFDNSQFDRGVPKWKEFLWLVLRSILFASWLPIPSGVKVSVLRLFGSKIGKRVTIRSRVDISFPWRFSCGDDVWIGDEVKILSLAAVTVGSDVCISQRSFLCTGTHDFEKSGFDLIAFPIKIASHCWVGANSFVGPGVSIEKGARCLAGSVVINDVGGLLTVGGVPAKTI